MTMRRFVLIVCATCLVFGGVFAQEGERPPRGDRPRAERRKPGGDRHRSYSIEQAVSDRAQLHTIAFAGLAFLTAESLGECTFLPPGKVCDLFGFQYMRDIDAGTGGHNTDFLTRIADNVLAVLNDEQKTLLSELATEQAPRVVELARRRFPLIEGFWKLRDADLPIGKTALDREAVEQYAAALWELDGELAYRRAEVFAQVLRSLGDQQKGELEKLRFGDSSTWPDRRRQRPKRERGERGDDDRLARVLVMTYASEMFSWHAGSLEADVYFCPERHGTYFGAFFLKDMPVMGKRGASISTELTGDSGAAFLAALAPPERELMAELVEAQREDLVAIVRTRRSMATQLRRFLNDETPSIEEVRRLARAYGILDGRTSTRYAEAFAAVNFALTDERRAELVRIRNLRGFATEGVFLYSRAIPMPEILGTESLFR